ncbi:uncharacterized protein PGTG_09171 [Puccinia graminis f. sp. tritici CRL 75-36-700-3]|uniref:Uncharacterized protein n=1 Tax=Puccinia graminis f. sp. tritici (strain CRL 75-36-700-3 / race SCCL) TaxID=418459 RepID=E3KFT3_PUCGT|nr:uncharacterized protein PGTG_09171 [Puccinia graminis f. sp. tritici CRL 75-36-700-3]EFP83218.1 hypothetical protein PGTG_09171 [Puccinia graminis f. sp. tritici CRL 75-36-700-3]
MIPIEDISTISSPTPGSALSSEVPNNATGLISAAVDDGVGPAVRKVTSKDDFIVKVVPGNTAYDEFQDLVAAACDVHVPNTGDIVAENKPDLSWNVTIGRVKGWLKGDAKTLTDSNSYEEWIAAMVASKKKDLAIGLALRMANPADIVKRGKQADILAKRAKLKKAIELKRTAKRKAGDIGDEELSDDEDEEIDPEDWNNVDFHMRSLFDSNPINREYDAHCPVFLHPTVPGRFILLTMEACQEWALAIMDDKQPAVNMLNPPRKLVWEDLGSPRKKNKSMQVSEPAAEDKASWCRMMVEAFVEVGKSHAAKDTDAPPGLDGLSYHPEADPPIGDYLRFLNVRNLDRVLEVLTANDIHTHKMFRAGSSLGRQEVLSLGLTFGVVTALYDNVCKYERFLMNNA